MNVSNIAILCCRKIFAFVKDLPKVLHMNTELLKYGVAGTVHIQNMDFLNANVTDPQFVNIQYALVKPNCSGEYELK